MGVRECACVCLPECEHVSARESVCVYVCVALADQWSNSVSADDYIALADQILKTALGAQKKGMFATSDDPVVSTKPSRASTPAHPPPPAPGAFLFSRLCCHLLAK